MQSALSTLLTPEVTIAILLVILIAETWAWFTMPLWYFGDGIPILRMSCRVLSWQKETDWAALLEEHQAKSIFAPFKFRQLDQGIVGFRESSGPFDFWRWGYTPVMRGVLKFDREQRTITLRGHVNYSMFLLISAATMYILAKPMGFFEAAGLVAFITLLVGGIYILQVIRYRELLHLCSFVRRS